MDKLKEVKLWPFMYVIPRRGADWLQPVCAQYRRRGRTSWPCYQHREGKRFILVYTVGMYGCMYERMEGWIEGWINGQMVSGLKGVVSDSNPIRFLPDSVNCSTRSSSCLFSVWKKHRCLYLAIHNPSQSTQCFSSTEGRGVISTTVHETESWTASLTRSTSC